jgi:hypothetical protein
MIGSETKPTTGSFSHFVFGNSVNKRFLLIALAGVIVQFVLFKLCYPFADFFTDSYTYIDVAIGRYEVSFRPTGYSRFLQVFHLMSTSDTLLVFIQYVTVQAGSLLLFFTVLYFFNPAKIIARILFVFLVFNPVSLYLSNYVSSDALFLGLSLFWITELIWIINRPRWFNLIEQAILLFLIFKLRYTALYYPVVASFAFVICRHRILFKITGVALSIVPIVFEMQRLTALTKKTTGTAVFSAFSGWQIANNALHMYPFVQVNNADLPAQCIELNNMVKTYFDTIPESQKYPGFASSNYMWIDNTPLKNYLHYILDHKKSNSYFNAWNYVGPIYSAYGYSLIKKHPAAFARYYLWPNSKAYLISALECLRVYNEGKDSVDEIAQKWFRYKSNRVHSVSKNFQQVLLQPFPYLFCIMNFIFPALLLSLLRMHKKTTANPYFLRSVVFIVAFWAVNLAFSVFSAPVIFRYQQLSLLILVVFSSIIVQQLWLTKKAGV